MTASLFDHCDRFNQLRFRTREYRDVRASSGKSQRDCATDAAAAAGHNGNLPF